MEYENLRLFEMLPEEIVAVDTIPPAPNNTKVLFLGGLLHLNGLGLTPGLARSFSSLLPKDNEARPFSVYTLAVGDSGNIGNLVKIGDVVTIAQNASGKIIPSHVALKIMDQIVLPDAVCNRWSALPQEAQQSEMENYFDTIRLVGYSHGTTLIQQIEEAMRQKLTKSNLPLTPLEKIAAINIGPVAAPVALVDGQECALFYDAMKENCDRAEPHGRFHQLLAARAADKIMSMRVEHRLLDKQCEDYAVLKAGNVVSVTEYCGDDMIRFMKLGHLPSGSKAPKIVYEFDSEGHALRLFANCWEAGQDISCVYPSSSFGTILRESMKAMLSPKGQNRNFENTKTIASFMDAKDGAKNKREAKENLESLSQEFDHFIATYRGTTYTESCDLILRQVDSVRLRSTRPAPACQSKPNKTPSP